MKKARAALLFALISLAWAVPAYAQFDLFGSNKIQYRNLDWRTLRGEHVDLYFYPDEEELARVALTYAEDSYRELELRFRLPVLTRIPMVIYASHYDFEQTNLLPFQPPEGLLGFTEFGRSRVALPFRGDYAEFRHTIRHELVHVFQLARGRLSARLAPRLRSIQFPLWFTEGSAEYFSAGEDTQDDMILRDITQSGRLPTIEQLTYAGGGIVYPIGGTMIRFLADTYGEWRIIQCFDDAWKYESFDELLTAVFGKTPRELSAEWQYHMKQVWYPSVETQRPLALGGRRLAQLALKPAVWTPPGDTIPQVLYISPRTGYTNIYSVSLRGGKPTTVVSGERTAQLESFHSFDSRMDVDSAGVLVFATRYMERDALVFWDIQNRRLVGRYQFPGIVSILSPAWSPDRSSVVFSGLTFSGSSDLYVLHLAGDSLERLTNDRYNDTDPSYSPDGKQIVFSSDRTPFGPDGGANLFIMDLATKQTRYLTYGNWRDKGPRWTPQGMVTFTSDRRGVQDIYVVDSTGAGRRESGVPGGVFDPVWIPSKGIYVLGGFEDLAFNIYTLHPNVPDSSAADTVTARDSLGRIALNLPHADTVQLAGIREEPTWHWAELKDPRYARTEPKRYSSRYTVDFAGTEGALIPGSGGVQAANVVLSDMLDDHILAIDILAFEQGGGIGDLVSNFNGGITYLNQSRRLNWGMGAFRLRGTFYDNTFDQTYRETATGAFGLLRYPLSRFSRVEGEVQLEYSDRTDYGFLNGGGPAFPHRSGILTSNFISFVHDNSLWMPTGPIDGGRERLVGGIVSDLQNGRFDSWELSADLRHYFRTGLKTTIALRSFLYLTGGERPQRITLGGSYSLRGYPRYTYVAGGRAWMLNSEWRFPLTDYLSLGLPFGEWRFPGIEGAFFADMGRAWESYSFEQQVIGSYGMSFRMNIGFPLVLRMDVGWRYGDRASYQLPVDYLHKHFVDFWFGFDY
ncbi:MAG TPA: hypothetical protein VGI92_14155 [Gemmatimonadales bacterium]|jgi:hypothetical protein